MKATPPPCPFPDEDFRPPYKSLDTRHVRYVDENIEDFIRERKQRGEDIISAVDLRPPPPSVADLPAIPQRTAAPAPAPTASTDPPARQRHRAARGSARRAPPQVDREAPPARDARRGPLATPREGHPRHERRLAARAARRQRRLPLYPGTPCRAKPVAGLELGRGDVAVRAVRHRRDRAPPRRRHAARLRTSSAPVRRAARARRRRLRRPLGRIGVLRGAAASITKGHPGAGENHAPARRARCQERLLFLTFGEAQRPGGRALARRPTPRPISTSARGRTRRCSAPDPAWTPPPPADQAIELLTAAVANEQPRLGPGATT